MHGAAAIVSVVLLFNMAGLVRPAGDLRRVPERGPLTSPDAFVPGEVLVKFRNEGARAKALATEPGLAVLDRIEHLGVDRLAGAWDVLATVARLRARPDVEYAEPNYLASLAVVPNDTFYDNVDGAPSDLQRWMYAGLDADPGLRAESAWDITTGRPDVVVGVVDSGIATDHPDLLPNLWINPGEIPNNGLDDDGNGFTDDFHGWDFFGGDADASPDLGDGLDNDSIGGPDSNVFHGTFVACLAAGSGNNSFGVVGASWSCKLMSLKTFTDDGGANNFHIAAALVYAADNGADVVNLSLTSSTGSSAMQDGVEYALARDCVLVAAAGNDNSSAPRYPARYPGVLSVGASDHGFRSSTQTGFWGTDDLDGRAFYSEYDPGAVDVVAPGTVFSGAVASVADSQGNQGIEPGDAIGLTAAGTSFSSPLVAGLAALLVSRDKELNGGVRTLSNTQVVDLIKSTAVDLPDDSNDNPNAGADWDNLGRVDFRAALEEVSGEGSGRIVRLTWKAPSGLGAPSELVAVDQQASSAQGRAASRVADARGGTVNEDEPNNTLVSAQALSPPVTVRGSIQTSDASEVLIVYENGDRDEVEDIYRFQLANETVVSINLTPDGDADLDLGMFTDLDGDGQYTIEQQYLSANPANGPGETEGLLDMTLPAGTYYIGCSIWDDLPRVNQDDYTLTVTTGGTVVTGYRVYRSTSPGVATTPANRIAETTAAQQVFVDLNAPAGAVYYVVTALYGTTESAASNEAAPTGTDPNAPIILGPTYKDGKLTLTAVGSKITAGAQLIVNGSEFFALNLSKSGSKWVVKKKTRSVPGGLKVSEAIPAGAQVALQVLNPDGLRSASVTFVRD